MRVLPTNPPGPDHEQETAEEGLAPKHDWDISSTSPPGMHGEVSPLFLRIGPMDPIIPSQNLLNGVFVHPILLLHGKIPLV